MKFMTLRNLALFIGLAGMSTAVSACVEEGPPVPPPPAPPEYAEKHMPEGWWADEKIIEEGRQIFIGAENIDVNCASCHGKDGKPVKAGARDFRSAERMTLYSDSIWFWRVSEGVKNTKMKPWKTKLPEEDRWKVIAYERTFGLKGKEYDIVKKEWVPVGTALPRDTVLPTAAPDGAPADGAPAEGTPTSAPAKAKEAKAGKG
ncbi:cytochrome c [Nitrospiraceae bacterium AH_259_D15_M11_P09]|nr:cytochrome c [Nitrospiraceae bacterium AH_259_D15_M11_P09]